MGPSAAAEHCQSAAHCVRLGPSGAAAQPREQRLHQRTVCAEYPAGGLQHSADHHPRCYGIAVCGWPAPPRAPLRPQLCPDSARSAASALHLRPVYRSHSLVVLLATAFDTTAAAENGTVVHGSFLAAPLRPLALPLPVTTMACGKAHWLLVTNDGSVFAQGDNRVGQLGLGHVEPVEEPTLVELLAGVAVVAVACGGQHSLALAGTGDVYSFGSNKHGQLGRDDVDSPAALPALVDLASGMAAGGPDAPTGQPDETVVEIAAGSSHSCAVVASGSAFLWGSGTYGQLGGPFEDCSRPRQLTLPKWYIDGVASGPCSWTTLLRVRARAGAAVSSGGDHADSVSSS
eukprot:m.25920 g.25920  ORF g.25920 m.25920 type:complete len:345 (+) comp4507_c0_seq1:230-1264(+)